MLPECGTVRLPTIEAVNADKILLTDTCETRGINTLPLDADDHYGKYVTRYISKHSTKILNYFNVNEEILKSVVF